MLIPRGPQTGRLRNVDEQRAQKGIFITTSRFTAEAEQYAGQVQNTVILVDGAQLARLMIEHGIGTSTVGSYEVKRLDSDYFLEE